MRILPLVALSVGVAACSMDQDSSRSFPLSPSLDRSANVIGQVYSMSNATNGNAVLAYKNLEPARTPLLAWLAERAR